MNNQAANITVLDFPDCVRMRKGMYIPNIEHTVFEIVDNSIDEHMAGYCNAIAVAIVDDTITVEDNGRGIPVTPHEKNPSLSQAEVAYTVLHAGGKFGDSEGYKTSTGGLHGVGASVVNALSEDLTLEIKTGGKKYIAKFAKGHIKEKLHIVEKGLNVNDTGTSVSFKLDPEIWGNEKVDLNKIRKRIQQLAYLNPGLTTYLYFDTENKDGKRVKLEEQHCYPEGLKSYIEKLAKNKNLVTDIISFSVDNDAEDAAKAMQVSVALAYTESYSEEIYTFYNGINTIDGGDHLTGFKAGLLKSLTDYIDSNNIKNLSFESDDVREGIIAVISVRSVKAPEFDGQGKAKVKSPEARAFVKSSLEEAMTDFLDANPNQAKIILNKITQAAKARLAAKKAREDVRKIKSMADSGNPEKIADCSSKKPEECELFIVEGDSAAGSAKSGRDRKTQAILPVFGKILNVEKARLSDVLNSIKMQDILKALKCGIGEEFDISKLRYHKIILLADADVDGSHIQILHTTFFYRYLRPIIENGYLYCACPPLYKIIKGKTTRYALNDCERDSILQELGGNCTIQRFKGIGEMNSDQLWETTMNPETRTLIQITVDDAEMADAAVTLCMGDNVPPRRDFIMENAQEADLDI